ncbi:MAG: hypothetical protein ABWW69_03500 [Pyrodictiaceae archaeon]
MLQDSRYECEDPPCIHVAVSFSRKKFAVFLETSDGDLIYIPLEKLIRTCETITKLLSTRFREAKGDEIDMIAEEELNAIPYGDG